jgi:hypothetical protein
MARAHAGILNAVGVTLGYVAGAVSLGIITIGIVALVNEGY